MSENDKFQPTIEEATMSSGLHRQSGHGHSLNEMLDERFEAFGMPSIRINVPSDRKVKMADLETDLRSISTKIGSNVKVELSFTIRDDD